jgi:hypothetical protein
MVAGMAAAQDTYTVVGSSSIVNGSEWTVSNTDNDMIPDGNGNYTLIIPKRPINAGIHDYKVVKNHSYDNGNWGNNGVYNGENASLTINENGTYTIVFKFNTNDWRPSAIAIKTASVAGSATGSNEGNVTDPLFGRSWNPATNDMTLDEDGRIFKLRKEAIALSQGNVAYKIALNHSWNNAYPSQNAILSIPEDGVYDCEFTFDLITYEVNATAKKCVAKIGSAYYSTLQAAVNAAKQMGGSQTINIIDNITEETVTIPEVANFKLTIDGQKDASSNYTVDATIVVDGLRQVGGGSPTNGASVTLQNIAFVKTTATVGVQAKSYSHDLTIQDCTYSGYNNDQWFLDASVDGPLYGVTVKNVTVEKARLIYGNLANEALFQNITATNDIKVGFNVKTSGTALIENCQVTTAKYAFRDYSDGYAGTFTLKDNTFISTSEADDEGVIVNRGGSDGTAHINVESGIYTGHLKVLSGKEGMLAISGGYFSEEFPQSYIAADLVAQDKICVPATDKEGYFTVGDPHYVAQIGDVKYVSLAAAVEDAQANDVITMIDNDNVSLTTAGSEVTIDKPLTITGAVDENGKPKFTIFGSTNGGLNNNSFNDLFLSCSTGTVTVSNIKFDGFGNEVSSVMGHSPVFIASRNQNAVIENVYICNLNCEGIHINGGTFTINNCNIDCSKTTNGIFTKGICVVNDAQGSIENTTITGVDCEDPNDTSAAIELQGSGDIAISGCTIQSNTIGIATAPVQDLTAGTSQVTISNCTVESQNIAVFSDGDKGALTSISSGNYYGLLMAGDNDEGFSISGGIFSDEPEQAYCAEGYATTANTDAATKDVYPYTVIPIPSSSLIVFHDSGNYEEAFEVPMVTRMAGADIYYKVNSGDAQKYTGPVSISEDTDLEAWLQIGDTKIGESVIRNYAIVEKPAGPAIEDGYYYVMNNGSGKYVNVAGRKTVTFKTKADAEKAAGAVIRVKAAEGGAVEVLRSQAIDLPGYATRAMNYVPEMVHLVVSKLHADGGGNILGANGLDAIMNKFKESFDYNLYLEEYNRGLRIYGRTPSMKPVVDFYAENKDNVDAKLPELETFINNAIEKLLKKLQNHGASILQPFSVEAVWEAMGGTLTKPEDAESTARFYEEVLASENNVWQFAYQTAMMYYEPLMDKIENGSSGSYQDFIDQLGDYKKYLDKLPQVHPNFKYYIVADGNKVDFISEGNPESNGDAATWTLEARDKFTVEFDENDKLVDGLGTKYYTTLYTDFAYTMPEKAKAYAVTSYNSKDIADLEELTDVIPAQTPVLLMTQEESLEATLTLSTAAGTAPTTNLLKGADWIINEYQLKTAQLQTLFDIVKGILGEDSEFYQENVAKYEHLMLKNAGLVNNKYFFGLSSDDLKDVENFRVLGMGYENKLGFHDVWTKLEANKAFLIEEPESVFIPLWPDINCDGYINVADVTALIAIVLDDDVYAPDWIYPYYNHSVADVNQDGLINVTDVTTLISIVQEMEEGE